MKSRVIASVFRSGLWALALGCLSGSAVAAVPDEIPRPDLSLLEPTARRQVEAEQHDLEEALARADGEESASLGARFGRLGQSFHAHGLGNAADACYARARSLATGEARWAYLAGVLAVERGDSAAAGMLFRLALETRPDDLAVLLRLAGAMLEQGDLAGAEELYRRSLPIETTAAAHFGLGRIAYQKGDVAVAIRELERALELQPTADRVHYHLARAYRREGDAAAAGGHLEQAGPLVPTFSEPFLDEVEAMAAGVASILERALVAFSAKRYTEAIAAYREALQLEPGNVVAGEGLELSLARSREIDTAADTAIEMLAKAPEEPLAQLEVGRVLLSRGRIDEGIEHLERAIELEPNLVAAYLALGEAWGNHGEWDRAAAVFGRALEVAPDDVAARLALALAREQQGRHGGALELLRGLLEEDPANVQARSQRARLLAEQGDLLVAASEYQVILRLAEATTAEKAVAHYQLARLHAQSGRSADALAHDREAARLQPRMWQAHFAVAGAMQAAGRWLEAAESLRRVIDIEPELVAPRAGEADALMRAGRFAAARERLDEGLGRLPQAAELAHLLARLLAVAPATELRDGARALDMASRIVSSFPSIEHAETVVMALAEQGRLEEAIPLQERLVEQARVEGEAELLGRLEANLSRYRSGERAIYP